jgi:hypothetical protein
MIFLECPGCELIAWDGTALYAASNTGSCSQLRPNRVTAFPGRSPQTFRHDLLQAKGSLILVGREVLSGVTIRSGLPPELMEGRLVCRLPDRANIRPRTTLLEDPEIGTSEFYFGNAVRYRHRFDHVIPWDESRILLANRHETLLFDLDATTQQASPFVLDSGTGRRQIGGANDRGVVQLLADPIGGFLALLEGGALARLTVEDGAFLLRPTPVMRNDWEVRSCQVTETRALFFHRGGQASLVDRESNKEVGRLRLGSGALTLHPNGNTIAVADGGVVSLGSHDSMESHQKLAVTGRQIRQVAFAPDGLTVAAATEQGVTLFDVG